MPDINDDDLDDKLLDARLAKARAASSSFSTPKEAEKPLMERALHQARGFIEGPGIGESIPVLGPLAAKAGHAAAAGFGALTSDEKFGDLYNKLENEGAADEAAYTKEYPVAAVGKSLAGNFALPVPGLGTAGAVAGSGRAANAIRGALGAADVALPQAATTYADTLLRSGDASRAGNEAENAGMMSGAMTAIPSVIGKVGRGASRVLTGLKDDTIDYYRANRGAVNAADMDDLVRSGRGVVKDITDTETTKRQDLAKYIESLQKDIRGQARQGSANAFDVLNQSDVTIPTRQLKSYPTLRMNQMKIGEATPNTPSFRALQSERQFLDDTQLQEMRPEDVKRYIMRLDQSLAPSFEKQAQGIPLEEGERALVDYRKFLDSRLKGDAKRSGVPGYAEAMQPVSDRMKALGNLGPGFTTPDRSYNTLSRLENPNMSAAREGLQGIQPFQSNPRDLVSEASQINQISAPLQGMSEGQFENLAQRMTRANPKLKDRELFDFLAKKAKGMPENTVPVQDFGKSLKDISVQQAFDKPYVKGSRNVNIGGLSLGGLGNSIKTKTGDLGGIAAAGGAVLGGMADLVGPQTVKRILDVIDSPAGERYASLYREAAKRGPQALAITHEMLKRTDQNYKKLTEGAP